MKQVYCDNSSTSFPKAPGLGAAVGLHIDCNGYNISRGSYMNSYSVEESVIETKDLLCDLLNVERNENVIFTSGATMSLNMILKGVLKEGDHLITSSMEHNAVVRPASQLVKKGIEWDEALCDDKGELRLAEVRKLIKANTKLILVTHGSNVCGSILPISNISSICKDNDIFFAVDAAQTAGTKDIDLVDCAVDAFSFAGHKGLLGPQGIGGIILSKKIGAAMSPIISGGTGSVSDNDAMPEFLPDKFQPGTLNIPGIIGLKHSLKFIQTEGQMAIEEKELLLTQRFIEGIKNIDNVRIIGKDDISDRCPVVSLDFKQKDNAEVSYLLDKDYGILTRCGLHCAPHAHVTLHTFPQGTVRFSFGYFNEITDIDYAIDSIYKLSI